MPADVCLGLLHVILCRLLSISTKCAKVVVYLCQMYIGIVVISSLCFMASWFFWFFSKVSVHVYFSKMNRYIEIEFLCFVILLHLYGWTLILAWKAHIYRFICKKKTPKTSTKHFYKLPVFTSYMYLRKMNVITGILGSVEVVISPQYYLMGTKNIMHCLGYWLHSHMIYV